ncbi:MAG: DUF4347 domain-containing protein, partial [Synechococcaceae cyanobacterium]|nr:DUF4347 domain-containing protein [Synechococcaceae cyanobacterium]
MDSSSAPLSTDGSGSHGWPQLGSTWGSLAVLGLADPWPPLPGATALAPSPLLSGVRLADGGPLADRPGWERPWGSSALQLAPPERGGSRDPLTGTQQGPGESGAPGWAASPLISVGPSVGQTGDGAAELFVISGSDASLDDLAGRLSRNGARVLQLQPGEGLRALVEHLQSEVEPGSLQRLHLINHGAPDQLRIGDSVLSSRNLGHHRALLEQLGSRLAAEGDLLLWGCDTAASAAGQRLVSRLAELTGADVAASADRTFADITSGRSDWELEDSSGTIAAGYQDLLTGLGWSGALAPSMSFAGGTLTISEAAGSFALKGTLGAGNTGSVTLTGASETTLALASALQKIVVSGSSYTITGLDLDKPGDTEMPDAYGIELSSEPGALFSTGNPFLVESDISLTGTLKSYGGNLKITQQNSAKDLPLIFLFPRLKSSIQLGLSDSSPLDLNLSGSTAAGELSITQTISIDPYLALSSQTQQDNPSLSSFVDSFLIDSVLNTFLYGLQSAFVPASVKVSDLSGGIQLSNANVLAASVNATTDVSLSLSSQASIANSDTSLLPFGLSTQKSPLNLGKAGLPWDVIASVLVGSADTSISLSASSITTTSGSVELRSTAANALSTAAQVTSNSSPGAAGADPISNPSGKKSGLAVGVAHGNTHSKINIGEGSSLSSAGSIDIGATSQPSGSASAKTSIWVDGAVALSFATNQDTATALINIDGTLTSKATGPAASPPPVSAIYVPAQAYSVSSGGAVSDANGQAVASEVALSNGQIIRFGDGNLFSFFGSSGSRVDLAAVDPRQDSRFAQAPAWSFAADSGLAVGDTVTVSGLAPGYSYRAQALPDGSLELRNPAGNVVARVAAASEARPEAFQLVDAATGTPGFRFQPGDVVLWSDGNSYQFFGEAPQTIGDYTGFPFRPASGWTLQSFLQADTPQQITALLPDASRPGVVNVVLAADQPQAISAAGSTGSGHLLYASGGLSFDGGSSQAVDLARSEILVAADEIDLYNRLAPGQVITYTVQSDSASGQDSFPIQGLVAGVDYYLLKRGIDASGRGRLALAASPDDVVNANPILFTGLGVGGVHLLSGELGATTSRLTLQAEASLTPSAVAPQAQSTALQLAGTYANGNSLSLRLLNGAAGSDVREFRHTFAGLSGSQEQIRQQAVQQLVTALNGAEAIGGGAEAFLRTSVDPAAPATLLLSALSSGVPFVVNAEAANASVAQISTLQLQGPFQSGERIELRIARDDGSAPTAFSYTTVSSDLQEIIQALTLFLQGEAFATASSGFVSVSRDAADSSAISLTARVPGEGFLLSDLRVTPAAGQSQAGSLQAITSRANVRDSSSDPRLDVVNLREAVSAPNWLGPALRVSAIDGQAATAPPDSLVNDEVAALQQGLLQAGDGRFLGADLFLSSDDQLLRSAGAAVSGTSLRPGQVVYVETAGPGGVQGAYRTYIGSAELTLSGAAQLRSLLTAPGSGDWLLSAGPNAYVSRRLDAEQRPLLQLLGVSSGDWSLRDSTVSAASLAPLTLEVGTPLLRFDPHAAGRVDARNNTLHLPGLDAFNGQVFTYYADPGFSRTVTQPVLASAEAGGAVAGSNRWNGVQLPASIADGRLVAATFYTGIPLPIGPGTSADLTPSDSTPPPAERSGLADRTRLYLRQRRDDQGRPDGVALFRDAAGSDPLLLGAAGSGQGLAYFQVEVERREGSTPIQGLQQGQQLQLHALGNDLYQVALDPLQYSNSQPFALRGQQITANTVLQKQAAAGSQTASDTSTTGISLTASVNAKDKAKATGGTGSNPKLRDFAGDWTLIYTAAKGNAGNFLLGTKFKDSIKNGGGYTKGGDAGSISGSVAINLVDHTAKVSLGEKASLRSDSKVTIDNQIKTLPSTWAEASTDLDNNKLGVLSVGLAINTINNKAETELKGSIDAAAGANNPSGTIKPDVEIKNVVAYPSLFFSTFGSGAQLAKYFSNPAKIVSTLSGASGALMQNSINTFATVKNKGKLSSFKDDNRQAGTNFAAAISLSISAISNVARASIPERAALPGQGLPAINANHFTVTNKVDNSLVLGAGMLHIDIGIDRIFSGFVGDKGSPFGGAKGPKLKAEGWSAAFQEFLSWGNVGKNGIGASLQLLDISNEATLHIGANAKLNLSGKLGVTNLQGESGVQNSAKTTQGANQLVSLAVGGGSSENFGLTGSVTVTYGKGNTTGTTIGKGAAISAKSVELNAFDKANKVDIAGALQSSSAIGISTSIIINQLQRRAYNLIGVPLQITDGAPSGDNLSLNAGLEGSITAISAAGTYQAANEDISKNTSNSVSYWQGKREGGVTPQITSLGLAAAGSINVLQLTDSAINRLGDDDPAAAVLPAGSGSYRIRSSASDSTRLNNWSGALAFGRNGATQPSGDAAGGIERRSSSGQGTIAGAAAVNQISREISNRVQNLDFGGSALSLSADASSAGAEATAGAISLAVGVNKSTTVVVPGSLAFNFDNPPLPAGVNQDTANAVSSSVQGLKASNLGGLQLSASNGADATAIAGSLGLAANPLNQPPAQQPPAPAADQGSRNTAATIGFSVAVNDLATATSASLSDSTLQHAADATPTVQLTARSEDQKLTAVSIAAAGSGSGGTSQGGLGGLAIAGSGAGAQNTFTNPVSARIERSSLTPLSSDSGPGQAAVSLTAAAGEQILSISGGLDVAIAKGGAAEGSAAALSVGASASRNVLAGAVEARIDPTSTLRVGDLTLSASDNGQIGAYAIAGALSGAISPLSSAFSGAFVGAGTGNTIDRPVRAWIGDPDYRDGNGNLTIGSGVVATRSTSLLAERGELSRIIADAAGAALAFSRPTNAQGKALGAGIAGGFAFNDLTGGISAGIHRLADYRSSGATTIQALARKGKPYLASDGNIASFAGGFAVSLNLGDPRGQALAAGGALGLAVSRNSIRDAVKAEIADLGLANPGKTLKLGALRLEARNERLLSSQATGDSLTVSRGGSSAVAVGVGAADSRNSIEGGVEALLSLGGDQRLELGEALQVSATDLARIETFALAVALTYAEGSSAFPLAGGGAGSSNTITAPVTARVKAGTVKNAAAQGVQPATPPEHRIRAGSEEGDGSQRRSRSIDSRLGAGSLAVAVGR